MEEAERAGRVIGIDPATAQVLDIRAMQKIGYRFDPDDLAYWQWRALVAVDGAIEDHKAKKAEEMSRRGHNKR